MVERISKITLQKNKICNKCGIDTVVYTVFNNGIVCSDCMPIEKTKKIPNEATMREKILQNANKNQRPLC